MLETWKVVVSHLVVLILALCIGAYALGEENLDETIKSGSDDQVQDRRTTTPASSSSGGILDKYFCCKLNDYYFLYYFRQRIGINQWNDSRISLD